MTRPVARARTGSLAAWVVLALLLVAATGPARADDPPGPAASAPVPLGASAGGAVATDADSAGRVAPTETPATAADAPPSAPAPAPAPAVEAPKPGIERLPLQPPVAITVPATLNDINAWLEYKTRGHLLALPTEARLFYRRGLLLHASGGHAEAERLVRGAARLDPGFIAPRLTLATWVAFRDPGEALDLLDQVWDFARGSFMVQFVIAANALYLAIQSLVLAIIAAGIVIVIVNGDRLRHGLFERLVPFISADTARWWSWLILAAPYLAGIGPALPTLVFLGMLWPSARLRERSLFVTLTLVLAGMPLLTATLDRVSSPLHEDRAPFYGVPQLQTEPDSPELLATVEARAAAHPDNAFLAFAAGWLAQRHGDAAASEAHYRAELRLRPDDDRALNNLGNALAAQGRSAEALDCYTRATQIQPRNAAAHFNASQIHTLDYDFHLANEELAKATALDFELVKTYQAERAEAKWTALVDQWISARDFWRAMRQAPFSTGAVGALPPLWRGRIECSGGAFSLIALAVAIAALGLGLWMNRAIPVRGCGNCGTPVCRRCAERKRTLALCSTCAVIESRSKSPEFGRVLLGQHRRRLQQRRAALYRVLGVLVPGLGYLPYRKLIRPIMAFAGLAALVCLSIGLATPFSYEPRFAVPGHDVPLLALGAAWLAFYLIATPTYLAFEQVARERARTLGAGPRPRPARPATAPDRAAA